MLFLISSYPEIEGFLLYDRIKAGEYGLLKEVCNNPTPPCTLSCKFIALKGVKTDYTLCPEIPEVLKAKYELFADTSSLIKLAKLYPYYPFSLKAIPLLDNYNKLRVFLDHKLYDSVFKYADTTKENEYSLYLVAKSKFTDLTLDEMLKLPKWYLRGYIVKPLIKALTDEIYDSIEVYLKVLADIGDEERAFRLMASEVAKPDMKHLGYRLFSLLKSYADENTESDGLVWLGISAYILGYIEDAYNYLYMAFRKGGYGDFNRIRAAFWLYKITRDTYYVRIIKSEDPLNYYSLKLGIKPKWSKGALWDTLGDTRFYEMGKIVEKIAGYQYARDFYLKNIPSAYKHLKDLLKSGDFYRASLVLQYIYDISDKSEGIPLWWGKLAYPYNKKFFSHYIDSASTTFGIDPLLFVALIREESRFMVRAQSPAGALGLSQIMPDKVKKFSRKFKKGIKDPYDPKTNLLIGAWVFSEYLRVFPDYALALASYNAGMGALNRWLCDYEYERLDYDLFIDIIPYNETRAYVRRVLKGYWIYKSLYSPGKFD
ncbi:MAG: lytic transglycosylase domain-containing protein [candidate division WOR-3 bacterium]